MPPPGIKESTFPIATSIANGDLVPFLKSLGGPSYANQNIPFSVINNTIVPWVTPLAYGAIGNGTTDDTLGLQNCINANRYVFLPTGYIFAFSSPLTISRSGVVICGSQVSAPDIQVTVPLTPNLKWIGVTSNQTMLHYAPTGTGAGISGCFLYGVVLDGGANGIANNIIGIQCGNASPSDSSALSVSVFEKVTVARTNVGFDLRRNTQSNTFRDCWVYNRNQQQAGCIRVDHDGDGGIANNVFDRCNVQDGLIGYDIGGTGVANSSPAGFVIVGGSVEGCTTAVFLRQGTAISIVGLYMEGFDGTGYGIEIGDLSTASGAAPVAVSISNCYLTGSFANLFKWNRWDGAIVNDNRFSAFSGSYVGVNSGSSSPRRGGVIIDNTTEGGLPLLDSTTGFDWIVDTSGGGRTYLFQPGSISLGAGSVGSPSLSFVGNSTAGVFSRGAGFLDLVGNGSTQIELGAGSLLLTPPSNNTVQITATGTNGLFCTTGQSASSGSPLINSPVLWTRGQYWTGSANANFDVFQLGIPTDSSGNGYLDWQFGGVSGGSLFNNGNMQVNKAGNGQILGIQTLTELTTVAASPTTTTAIQIPANTIVVGVSVRVTVAIPTATTFTVTGTSSGTVFNTAAISVNLNSTDPGTKAGAYANGAAQTITITPNGTPGTNVGRVRVTIHYVLITPPTS